MFTEKVLSQSKILEDQWLKECRRLYKDVPANLTTEGGVPIKPIYTPADIADLDFSDIGVPGEYPYTRGLYPLQAQTMPLINEVVLGYGLPEDTRARFEALKKEGMAGYQSEGAEFHIACDLPTYVGYDPDHPLSQGRVGQGGVTLSTIKDLEILFSGIPLDKNFILFNVMEPSIVMLALYVVYAEERRGIPRANLRGMTLNLLYRQWYSDCIGFPPENAFKLMIELIKFCSQEMPRWNHTSVEEYTLAECGASAVQQVAFTLATIIALNEECIKAGLEPDDFVSRYSPHLSAGNDFFETIAKMRAYRRLWAKIHQERFKCKNPKSLQTRFFAQTSGSALTAQQPLNNIIRASLHTLAAVLGSANTIHTGAYDEVYAIPTEEAAILALRTQQIIQEETNVTKVGDPLAGSYYVEWLTARIEKEALELIEQIAQIGYINAWKSGWLKEKIVAAATKWRRLVDRGEKIVVGVNKYISTEKPEIPLFKVNPETEQIAIERLRQYKRERDNPGVNNALNELENVAIRIKENWPEGGDLMPALLQSARAEATLGEMMEVLRKVFGWGYAD